MAVIQFPATTPSVTPTASDLLPVADVSAANILSDATIQDVVLAWLWANDTDSLPEWSTNLYMTLAEQTKLAWIDPFAQPRLVDQVNGQVWNVTLTQDDIPDGTNFKQTHNDFDNTDVSNLTTAFAHTSLTNNPHATTATQVGLGSVTNYSQLKRAAGDYNTFPAQPSPNSTDILLIERASAWFAKQKVTLFDLMQNVISFVSATANLVKNSLQVTGGKIQLLNDLATPEDHQFYGTKSTVKWWFWPLMKTIIETTETLTINANECLVVAWPYIVQGTLIANGTLYIL